VFASISLPLLVCVDGGRSCGYRTPMRTIMLRPWTTTMSYGSVSTRPKVFRPHRQTAQPMSPCQSADVMYAGDAIRAIVRGTPRSDGCRPARLYCIINGRLLAVPSPESRVPASLRRLAAVGIADQFNTDVDEIGGRGLAAPRSVLRVAASASDCCAAARRPTNSRAR